MSSSLKWFLPGAKHGTMSSGQSPHPAPPLLTEAGVMFLLFSVGGGLETSVCKYTTVYQALRLLWACEIKDTEEVGGHQPISRDAIYIIHQRASPEKRGGRPQRKMLTSRTVQGESHTSTRLDEASVCPIHTSNSVRITANPSSVPNLLLSLFLYQPTGPSKKVGHRHRSLPSPSPPHPVWPSSTSLCLKYSFFIYFT